MESSLQKEIKESLLQKVLEENKINTFIKSYFKINETTILSIYENLLNSIFSLNKENEEIVKEMLTLLKQKEWFLLDNIFSVFRPGDEDLKTLLFKPLNLKDNELRDKWILVLSESTFSDNKINDFFEEIKNLIEHYREFVNTYFLNKIEIPDEIYQEAQKRAEEDILNVYLLSDKDYSQENKNLILQNNRVKVEKRRLTILKDRYKNELNSKLKELFDNSLQTTINEELKLLNLYISKKLSREIIPFILKNKIDQFEVDQKIIITKLSTGKIQNIEQAKLKIKNLKDRSIYLQNIFKKLSSLELKEEKYITLGIETLNNKLKRLTKSTFLKTALFPVKFKSKLTDNLKRLLSDNINFDVFNKESEQITKYFLFDKVFTPWKKSYEVEVISEIVNGNIISKKLDGKKWIEDLVDIILKTYKKDFQTFWEKFDKYILLQYYLFKYKKNKNVSINFFQSLDEKFEKREFEHFLIENMPSELAEIMRKKIRDNLLENGLEAYELNKEEDRQKQLIYKVITKLTETTFFQILDEEILSKWLNEKELLFLINKEEKKLLKTKYRDLVEDWRKEKYYNIVYKKFLTQKEFIEKLNDSFLTRYKDFKEFYTNYIYLLANKEMFAPIYNEFNWINHKDYLYLPSEEKSYIKDLVTKLENLWNNLKKEIKDSKLNISFLEQNTIETINEILINLESISKVNILFFINYILTTSSLQINIQESFISVIIWDKVFIFFNNPSFEVLNNITIYFMNNDKEKEKIFILTKWNFYYFLNQAFSSNINLSGVQHEFKNILEYSYHNKNISDISIFGSKSLNAWYILIRENKVYNLCKFKAGNESSSIILFKSIEKIIENIIMLWGSIEDTKVVDSTITVGWVEYRTSILRDWDRIWITLRKNWHKSKLLLTSEELQKKYNLEYDNIALVKAEENIPLDRSYDIEDIKVFQRYALQDDWIFWVVWKTGSWKSVSIRNILNFIFEQKLKEGIYSKIITLEDPIEVKNLNFTQYNVKWDELLQFIKWLKRSDPDILLIWETRSYEMLMDVLEFSQMMGVFTTLHASSIISTLFLLGQYALRANVWMTDIINQTKVIVSQKLLKIKNPKISIEQWLSDWTITLYTIEEKKDLIEWFNWNGIFKQFFSSYLWKGGRWKTKEIVNIEKGLEKLETLEEKEKYKLWLEFKDDFINKWKIIKDINLKKAWDVKLYYEYGERNLFKDNLSLILSLSDKDTEIVEVERMFAWKTKLKEERAFIDMINWVLTLSEFLTLSGYLTPVIYHKLKLNKQIVDWVYIPPIK